VVILVSKYYPPQILREMADSRNEVGKVQDEPGNLLVPERKEILNK